MQNRDHCGRCHVRHGGNDHLCSVHGPVSAGCCEPRCRPDDWQWVADEGQVPVEPERWERRPGYGWVRRPDGI